MVQQRTVTIEMTPFHRVSVLSLIITEWLLFLVTYLLIFSFFFYPIRFLFSYDSLVDSERSETHYFHNGFLYCLFWVQHILMATLKFKMIGLGFTRYFALYQRYFYNIFTQLIFIYIFVNVKVSQKVIFELSLLVTLPLTLAGAILYVGAQIQLGQKIMMPFELQDIMNSKQLVIPKYGVKSIDKIEDTGLYGISRNPMQAGFLILFLFGSNIYTVDRLIFIAVTTFGLVTGVFMEQKRMLRQFDSYKDYMQKVRARFILI